MMDRRRFLQTVGAGVLAAPLAAEAQADRVYRIGLIGVDAGERAGQAAPRQGLDALGHYDRLPTLTAEPVARSSSAPTDSSSDAPISKEAHRGRIQA